MLLPQETFDVSTYQKEAKRIVCLVPSLSEFLCELGLGDRVIGITKFCVHPKEWHQSKNRVGGTKTVKLKKIHDLQPDLIIANQEENEQSQIEELSAHYPVFLSQINTVSDSFKSLGMIGQLCNKEQRAKEIINELKATIQCFQEECKTLNYLYFIWKDPYMVAGQDSYINHFLKDLAWKNKAEMQIERYPELSISEIKQLDANVLLFSSEPYPFKERHLDELKNHFPDSNIELINGEWFSWYGVRILKEKHNILAYLKTLTKYCQ